MSDDLERLADVLDGLALRESNRMPDDWRGTLWAFLRPYKFGELYGAMIAYQISAALVRALQTQGKQHDD